jgi:hypothetical protein
MYYLGSFGTRSLSKVLTVQDRMRLLREKEKNKLIEEENKAPEPQRDPKKKNAIYISSK